MKIFRLDMPREYWTGIILTSIMFGILVMFDGNINKDKSEWFLFTVRSGAATIAIFVPIIIGIKISVALSKN